MQTDRQKIPNVAVIIIGIMWENNTVLRLFFEFFFFLVSFYGLFFQVIFFSLLFFVVVLSVFFVIFFIVSFIFPSFAFILFFLSVFLELRLSLLVADLHNRATNVYTRAND